MGAPRNIKFLTESDAIAKRILADIHESTAKLSGGFWEITVKANQVGETFSQLCRMAEEKEA